MEQQQKNLCSLSTLNKEKGDSWLSLGPGIMAWFVLRWWRGWRRWRDGLAVNGVEKLNDEKRKRKNEAARHEETPTIEGELTLMCDVRGVQGFLMSLSEDLANLTSFILTRATYRYLS